MRGALVGTIAVAGLGLFGTGVHGLAQVDGKLEDAAGRPAVHDVRNEAGAKGECPYPEKQRRYYHYERRQL